LAHQVYSEMDGRSRRNNLSSGIIGPLYAFLYFTLSRRLMGPTLAGWLKSIPVAAMLFALLARRPLALILAAGSVAILIRALYWKARRDGYVTFVGQAGSPPQEPIYLPSDTKISLRATGQFAVKDREDYVLLRPADYWRVPMGDHAIMVEQRPGRFLYQFIQPGSLQHIEPGLLFFGRRPKRSLALRYLSAWGPDFAGDDSRRVPSKNGSSALLQRSAYLTFDDEESLFTVWCNLLEDYGQPISKKI
jgi:hypothetical protein